MPDSRRTRHPRWHILFWKRGLNTGINPPHGRTCIAAGISESPRLFGKPPFSQFHLGSLGPKFASFTEERRAICLQESLALVEQPIQSGNCFCDCCHGSGILAPRRICFPSPLTESSRAAGSRPASVWPSGIMTVTQGSHWRYPLRFKSEENACIPISTSILSTTLFGVFNTSLGRCWHA